MFEVGFTEIILIFGIALLVLGPARLPKLAADLGRWAGRARSMARQLRSQLEQEVQFDPLAPDTKPRPASSHETIHTPPPAPPAPAAPPEVLAADAGASAQPAARPMDDAPEPPAAAPLSPDLQPTTVPDERKPG
jgi:Tat protein translocase TatB subunit